MKKEYTCKGCPALCCNNLVSSIFKPTTKKEIVDLAWHLHFDTVSVFLRNKRWYMYTKGKCMYIGTNNKCMDYENRSDRCRQHNPPGCERHGKWYDVMLETPADLRRYLNKKVAARR